MITVHHLENSRSQRILWILEELNLKYEIKEYKRDPKNSLAPDELKNIHPLGKSPVITDDKGVHAESGAIIEYLIDEYGRGQLRPNKDSEEFRNYTYFMHYSEGSVMPILVMSVVFNKIKNSPAPFFIKPILKGLVASVNKMYIRPTTHLHIQFIESHLEKNQWFSGETFTAADIQMSYPVEAAEVRADLSKYPNIKRYLTAIRNREAYKRAIENGGPFEIIGG